jgi:transposase
VSQASVPVTLRTTDRPKPPVLCAAVSVVEAVRAAREALGHDRPAIPRRRREREALRVLLTTRRSATTARVAAVGQPRGADRRRSRGAAGRAARPPTSRQMASCAGLRERPTRSLEHRVTVRALRATAERIQFLHTEAEQLQAELTVLVRAVAPWLLEVPGVGALSAAQVLVSWSHAGRFRSEAAVAALAGTNPIPASSGQVTRYRLNRGGDRQLNRALHTIVLVRLRTDPETRASMARRTAQGTSRRDAKRCLRRVIARQLFRLPERYDRPGVEILRTS